MKNPADIRDGFDVHVVFPEQKAAEARQLFADFMRFVEAEGIPHERAMIFEKPVGPWPTPMWQILLRRQGSARDLAADLGQCLSWMMINRGSLSAMFHPNTEADGDFGGGLRDHRDYSLWLGEPLELKLDIFGG